MRIGVLAATTALLASGITVPLAAPASGATTFPSPDYPSADCTPVSGGRNLGLSPQQWRAAVGLPLTPSGTPLPQRIVVGELDQIANTSAVNLLLAQCGLPAVSVTTRNAVAPWAVAQTAVGLEATLDIAVVASAVPANTEITLVNTASVDNWYGMIAQSAEACGLVFASNPLAGPSSLSKGPDFPSGGCIITMSYGTAEPQLGGVQLTWSSTLLDQLAEQGVIVVSSAGDEGSGACLGQSTTFASNPILVNIATVSIASNVMTITTATPHGFNAGNQVYVGGLYPEFDLMYTILTVPTTTTYTVAKVFNDVSTVAVAGAFTSVNFGGLVPQFPTSHAGVLGVGGVQWSSPAQAMTDGINITYVPGVTTQNYAWRDSFPNSNCANLPNYPSSGGQGTGGGQSAINPMPAYQVDAAVANYPGLPARRMAPDLAALAGWPTYAIANPGLNVGGAKVASNVATLYFNSAHGLVSGEQISVSEMTAPFTGLNSMQIVTATTPTTVTFTTTGIADIPPQYVTSGAITQSCATPCSNTEFPWVPTLGTSAAAPLIATGFANINAVLSARGLPLVNNAGGSLDVHTITYASEYRSAFSDVVSGNNDIHSLGGWDALSGYDMTTGMGVPNFTTMVNLLITRLSPVPPATAPSAPAPAPAPTVAPQPTPEPQATPPSEAATPPAPPAVFSLGAGVRISTGPNVASTKRVRSDAQAKRKRSNAPDVAMQVRRWAVPVVRTPRPSTSFRTQILINQSWVDVGSEMSNTKGTVALPSIRFTRAGKYPVRLSAADGRTYFVSLSIDRV
jgi:hypothetical protein